MLKITNPQLNARAAALGSGLIRTAGLSHESNVLLLLNDSLGVSCMISCVSYPDNIQRVHSDRSGSRRTRHPVVHPIFSQPSL
jgi:hypothetical protein